MEICSVMESEHIAGPGGGPSWAQGARRAGLENLGDPGGPLRTRIRPGDPNGPVQGHWTQRGESIWPSYPMVGGALKRGEYRQPIAPPLLGSARLLLPRGAADIKSTLKALKE